MRLGSKKFTPGAAGYVDAANACLLARFSRMAYLGSDAIEHELARRVDQPNSIRYFGNDAIDTFGYVADYSDYTVVAWRGSDGIKDWMGNIQASKKSFCFAPGLVHGGFGTALDMTWTSVLAALQPSINDALLGKRSIWITGHDLGGALAVLCAARCKTEGIPVGGLVTFGQPMVGNASLCGLLRRLEYWRVVNCRDIVPRLPSSFAAGQYVHAGRFYWLRGSGNVRIGNAAESIYLSQISGNAASRAIDGRLDALADHCIQAYCDNLEIVMDAT